VKRVLFRAAAGFLGLASLLGTHLSAQQLATLNVTVADPSGRVISQARVAVRNVDTGAKRTDLSSGAGIAAIPGLPAGSYQLTVESDQFSPYQATLTLTVGQIAALPVTLGVATVKQQVELQDTMEGIDTQKSEVSEVIDAQKISDLPISGRDFIDFVLLTPTVNVGRSTSVGAQSPFQETVLELSLAGLRKTHSAFFGLDGTDYTTSISGVQRESPSQVTSSPYTADNGRNNCCFCQLLHGAAAAEHLGGDYDLIDRVKQNYATAEISDKLKSLLAIAGKVQKGGKHVTPQDVARAHQQGATDQEIHDTVLIAAAFCMFNRYVDGLDTWQPTDPNDYREMGQSMAQVGYVVRPDWEKTGEAA
jgi:uncharacterized peroxidase-related enzyme